MAPKNPPRIYCCVNGCLNMSVKRPELSFFKLPSEEDRRNEWLQLISREDLSNKKAKSYVVCEEHFYAHEILRAEHRKNLKKNAVPSLKLPGSSLDKKVAVFEIPLLKVEKSTQTTETNVTSIIQTDGSPRKRKITENSPRRAKRTKIEDLDNKSLIQQKEVFYKLCDKFLPKEYSELVKNKCTLQTKTPHLTITTEINETVLSILKVKVEHMKEQEKICSVIIDSIDIRAHIVYNTKEDKFIGFHEIDGEQTSDPATVAIVLMIRGIVFNWQQPVGFAMLSEYRDYDNVNKWIERLLDKLEEIGLDVKAIVSDMGTDVYNLSKTRRIFPEKPFFTPSQRLKKIFHIFDASHLFVMIRDSFLHNEFHFHGHVANLDHIKQFYSNDCEKTARLAPKLTQNHIDPKKDEKIDVHMTAQLFSNSVAAAILTYIDFYVIDESGRDTVKFIKLMNDLFDLLNSVKLKDNNDNVFKKAFNGDPEQIKLFTDAMKFFRSLRLVDPTTNNDVTYSVIFIEGFQITICAIMLLLEDLLRKGIPYLHTKRLSTDATKNFFAQIRSKFRTDNITSRQFITAFRELLIKDLMKPPSGKDCSLEVANLLSAQSTSESQEEVINEINDTKPVEESENNVKVKSSDYNQIEIPDKNTVVYLSSHLMKRCAEKHKDCELLKPYVTPAPEQRIENFESGITYQRYREYCEQACSSLIVVPYDDFIAFVEQMEEEFRNIMKKKRVEKKIATNIYKEISNLNFSPPCPCFPMEYLKRLFVRMRIFQTVQANNNKWKLILGKRKYFTIPNL